MLPKRLLNRLRLSSAWKLCEIGIGIIWQFVSSVLGGIIYAIGLKQQQESSDAGESPKSGSRRSSSEIKAIIYCRAERRDVGSVCWVRDDSLATILVSTCLAVLDKSFGTPFTSVVKKDVSSQQDASFWSRNLAVLRKGCLAS